VTRRAVIVLLAVLLTTAACADPERTATLVTPSSAAGRPSTRAPAPQPTYTDITRGDSTSVVKLYAYDPRAHSAVAEPVIFLDGPAFCKAFKLKSSDPRCDRDWATEESHTKVTVPVVAQPKLMAWDDHHEGDCTGTITSGGVCRTTTADFADWLRQNPKGFAVLTVKDGTVTKIAEMFTP
jgi:hypothetical protein